MLDIGKKKKRSAGDNDLKWISGILLVVFLFLTLATFVLFQMTAKEFAVGSISKMFSLTFETKDQFDNKKIDLLRKNISKGRSDYYRPFHALNLIITKKDVSGLSNNKIRANFNRRFSERLYEGGPVAVRKMVKKKLHVEPELQIISIINRSNHQKLRSILVVLLIISCLLMAGLIFFSNGLGRLINPGLAFLIVSILGFLWIRFIDNIALTPLLKEIPMHENDLSGVIGMILNNTLSPTAEKLYPINMALFTFGLILLIVAGVVVLTKRLLHHESAGTF